jgi:hypothetical protein
MFARADLQGSGQTVDSLVGKPEAGTKQMNSGFSGLGLFVIAVATLAIAKTAAIAARLVMFYALRLNGNIDTVNWAAYAAQAPVVLSAVLMAAALYVILAKPWTTQDKYWAYGTLGTLVGFWLR